MIKKLLIIIGVLAVGYALFVYFNPNSNSVPGYYCGDTMGPEGVIEVCGWATSEPVY